MPSGEQLNAMTHAQLMEVAKQEFGENPVQLEADVVALKEWVKKSPHLQNIKKEDEVYKVFLRGCKYSLERAKEKLDFFYTVKTNLPDWFGNWDPRQEIVQRILKAGIYLPLRGYDKHGRFVLLMRNGNSDPKTMQMEEMFKVSTMVSDLAMKGNLQAIIKGFVLIQDMEGMNASHAMMIGPALAKKAMTVWQDAYPIKPKALHFLNLPPVMESIFNMVQNLQKEKMRKRNHVHPRGSLEQLHEDIGVELLPKEYGGTNGTLEELKDYWKQQVEDNRDWLIQQTTYKTDESKRPGKPKLHSDIFGIEGSFRKLEID